MRARSLAAPLLFFASCALAACGGYRIPRTPDIDPYAQVDGPMTLGQMRIRPSVCQGVDLRPDYATLTEGSITDFLKKAGYPFRVVPARSDLVFVELQINADKDEWVRLRVAILKDQAQAAAELHRAMLEHGPDWWGLRRGNLAVLGQPGDLENIVALVSRTKLACWGMLSVSGRDDVFAVPGGYREL